jgi:hypothetical protein
MALIRLYMTMSLDGYVTGPQDSAAAHFFAPARCQPSSPDEADPGNDMMAETKQEAATGL